MAHQGRLTGWVTNKIFAKAKRNGGKFPKIMVIGMKLMGLSEDDFDMLNYIYWDASYESIKRNVYQNYVYHAKPSIAEFDTKMILCCGSKEPYAKKSHKILKKYLKNYKEIILEGYGHGEMAYKHSDELCEMIVNEWEG